jgi:drug/metabolite transporter (DMT)-like permease
MIALGIILLVLGYFLHVYILQVLGIILLVIGAVLWVLGSVGRPVAGRRYWY